MAWRQRTSSSSLQRFGKFRWMWRVDRKRQGTKKSAAAAEEMKRDDVYKRSKLPTIWGSGELLVVWMVVVSSGGSKKRKSRGCRDLQWNKHRHCMNYRVGCCSCYIFMLSGLFGCWLEWGDNRKTRSPNKRDHLDYYKQ